MSARFLIAFPSGDNGNDITTNAQEGNGGNITINAQAVFGIEERPLNPSTNDIDASSARGAQFNGSVSLNLSDVNIIQGITELPSNIVEPEQTTAQACQRDRVSAANNTFTIKGKGGIPPEPTEPLNSLNITVNGQTNPTSTIPAPIETSQGKIQPARGIRVTESGEVILTAYRTNNSGERIPEIKDNCG